MLQTTPATTAHIASTASGAVVQRTAFLVRVSSALAALSDLVGRITDGAFHRTCRQSVGDDVLTDGLERRFMASVIDGYGHGPWGDRSTSFRL